MSASVPAEPKIYHIVHIDRLPSIATDGHLWSDEEMTRRNQSGTGVGMSHIKTRRRELSLASHPGLPVGSCVPFYFCPRSVMLFLIHRANDPDLTYQGGQAPIVHLEAGLRESVAWAEAEELRWAFTSSNAGAFYFEDWADLDRLHEVDWEAVEARDWRCHKEGKQAEFLVERRFAWEQICRIGVLSLAMARQVRAALQSAAHRPPVEVLPSWYY